MSFTVDDVIDEAQVWLNDVGQATYTDARLIPIVKVAHREIRDRLLSLGMRTLMNQSDNVVSAGTTSIDMTSTTPTFLLPIKLEERLNGSTLDADYQPMKEVYMKPARDPDREFREWWFRNNIINFIAATVDRQVRIHYYGALSPAITNGASVVNALHLQNYLSFRTAAIAARTIHEDVERSADLNEQAQAEMELLLSTFVKNEQSINTRRRPRRRRF